MYFVYIKHNIVEDINTLRRPRPKAVKTVKVDKTMDADNKTVYTVDITPLNCDNSFDKFNIHSSQVRKHIL